MSGGGGGAGTSFALGALPFRFGGGGGDGEEDDSSSGGVGGGLTARRLGGAAGATGAARIAVALSFTFRVFRGSFGVSVTICGSVTSATGSSALALCRRRGTSGMSGAMATSAIRFLTFARKNLQRAWADGEDRRPVSAL